MRVKIDVKLTLLLVIFCRVLCLPTNILRTSMESQFLKTALIITCANNPDILNKTTTKPPQLNKFYLT